MTFPHIILLFVAAILGGTLNSVAGGGSFFAFPALLFTGVPPVQANATNTVALWPGSVASMGAYRRELTAQKPGFIFLLIGSSLIGSILGAQLLLGTSQTTFVQLLPYLMLMATLLFTFSPFITQKLRAMRSRQKAASEAEVAATEEKGLAEKAVSETTAPGWKQWAGMAVAQLIIAIYGGYFGGGIGILMLATLSMMGMENIHEMNGVKTLLTAFINGAAMITFIIRGAVFWPEAILMVVGAIIGGYGGAYYARKIEQKWIRIFVMVVGFALTIYFFVKPFLS
jgi:uncharacterized membrane protein YfcA